MAALSETRAAFDRATFRKAPLGLRKAAAALREIAPRTWAGSHFHRGLEALLLPLGPTIYYGFHDTWAETQATCCAPRPSGLQSGPPVGGLDGGIRSFDMALAAAISSSL